MNSLDAGRVQNRLRLISDYLRELRTLAATLSQLSKLTVVSREIAAVEALLETISIKLEDQSVHMFKEVSDDELFWK